MIILIIVAVVLMLLFAYGINDKVNEIASNYAKHLESLTNRIEILEQELDK